MSARARSMAAAVCVGLLAVSVPAYAVSCLLFPLSCLKPKRKYGEDIDGQMLDIRTTRTEYYEVGPGYYRAGWSSLENKRTWYIWFKVSHTIYQAEMTQSMYNFVSFKPKRDEWVGKPVTLRFMDNNFMGFKTAWVSFRRPNGKEWKAQVVSIIGPDGVNECNAINYCKPQADIDREAREAEQLARVQNSGGRSATDVAPAPVELPEAPPEAPPEAATAGTAPAPTEAGAPAAPAEAVGAPAEAASPPADAIAPAADGGTAAPPAEATSPAPAAQPAPASEPPPATAAEAPPAGSGAN